MGGGEDYAPARTLRVRNRTHFLHGVQGRFKALSCYMRIIFKHSGTKRREQLVSCPPVGCLGSSQNTASDLPFGGIQIFFDQSSELLIVVYPSTCIL